MMNPHSSSISPSNSTSSPGDLLSALIALRASFGRLKLVLLLEAPLPERADMAVPGRPMLEIEVRRDDVPDASAPVVEVGDADRAPPSDVADNSNSRAGISNQICLNKVEAMIRKYTDLPLLFHLSQHCIERKVF
jgi:hypothetical protein